MPQAPGPGNPSSPPGGFLPNNPASPSPPFALGTLHAPLTAVQRVKITAYLVGKGYSISLLNLSGSMEDDQLLIVEYEDVLKGGGLGNAPTSKEFSNPLSGVGAWFASNLLRLGEIVVGVVIVGVGIAAVARGKK